MINLPFLAQSQTLDGNGVCGSVLHYALTVFLVGSAFLVFLYLWRKGRLDMDEEPKIQMMEEDRDALQITKNGKEKKIEKPQGSKNDNGPKEGGANEP